MSKVPSLPVSADDRIAVVIPSFRVTRHVLGVIESIPARVWRIYVVDDACPEGSGRLVERDSRDPRVHVLFNLENQGVGGAVIAGYLRAAADGARVIVKIDGDGQMDPGLIDDFVFPILAGEADYTKGNRFFDLDQLQSMPRMRVFGNAALSLLAKFSTGYWDLFDPTNGYTAIHVDVLSHLPLDKISRRYFFETDILFRLNVARAVAVDVPMAARYADEVSNLKISRIVGDFLFKHARNFGKRIFYNYYLRDMSLASLELPLGLFLFFFGAVYGTWHWIESARLGIVTTAGTVMLAGLPVLTGLQLVLAFFGQDIGSVPRRVRHSTGPRLRARRLP
ncbi:glycosyl transferase family 2 [Rhodoferax koreense]|uniref:Glycosyl transferase family 2 n=1 Tax=Rhodoferax koreensis TaxID=1842727 RepID=A0A1P8JRY4_9BURK|nr:glycosyltransferase family 2 protein [Rhodoferax koreense]APW36524.1 glycosyl transferase family 2 [Rhodoferax koreense]